MLKMKKIFIVFMVVPMMMCGGRGMGQTLSGMAHVNVTSDTAAVAKNMALDEARRQIITDALSMYADAEQLTDAVRDADAADLTNLISSTSIDGERLSDTTYSANITMTIDGAIAKKWMTDANISNWLNDGVGDKFVILVTLRDGLDDWMELNRIARGENVAVDTKYIMGRQVAIELPAARRSAFTASMNMAGWHYVDDGGMLRLWK